jgi:hypothetical protein
MDRAPRQSSIAFNLALAYFATKQREPGLEAIRTYLKLQPDPKGQELQQKLEALPPL